MVGSFKDALGPFWINEIQQAYIYRQIYKTGDCISDMEKANLYEADVHLVIMNAKEIEKIMPAKSGARINPKNTHYEIPGVSVDGRKVYCKICSTFHPDTDEFISWCLTSFCEK